MPDTLRAEVCRALVHTARDNGMDAEGSTVIVGTLEEMADAVMAVANEYGPDDLDQYIREQARKDPAFATSCMRSQDAARVRAVRSLHRPYRGPSGEQDWCEHCNRISGAWIAYPCETIQAIGGGE
jgi:hypothetical protein